MKGSNTEAVKKENGRNILNTIYMYGPISRIEIAQRLGLTPPTITGYVSQFLAKGLIEESDKSQQADGQMGRHRTDLDIVPSSSHVIGIDVGPHSTYMALTDLRGNVLIKKRFSIAPADYGAAVKYMAQGAQQMINECNLRNRDISGIGIGIPGSVQRDFRTLEFSSIYSWRCAPLAEDMEKLLGIRTIILNNARARSIALEMFSDIDITDVYTYIYSSKGIASPCVVGSHELIPYHVSPGEIGHITLNREGHLFEHVAGDAAIMERCMALVEKGEAPILSSLIDSEKGIMIGDVTEAQRRGESRVCDIVDEACCYLGIALANLANVFDPPLIIIDAGIMSLEKNRETLLYHAKKNLYSMNREDLRFEFVDPDVMRTACGAAGFAVKMFVLMEAGASIIKI